MILVLLALVLPQSFNNDLQAARVDIVEVNHYYNQNGKHVFDQLIFYDWSSQRKRFDVRGWRLIKSEQMLPQKRRNHWLIRWHDDGFLSEVIATGRRETWTYYDPETLERDYLPPEQRKPLFPGLKTEE